MGRRRHSIKRAIGGGLHATRTHAAAAGLLVFFDMLLIATREISEESRRITNEGER